MPAKRKGPPVKFVDLLIDPTRSAAAMTVAMTIPGYVFCEMERRGIKARLKFVREDLAGAA